LKDYLSNHLITTHNNTKKILIVLYRIFNKTLKVIETSLLLTSVFSEVLTAFPKRKSPQEKYMNAFQAYIQAQRQTSLNKQ